MVSGVACSRGLQRLRSFSSPLNLCFLHSHDNVTLKEQEAASVAAPPLHFSLRNSVWVAGISSERRLQSLAWNCLSQARRRIQNERRNEYRSMRCNSSLVFLKTPLNQFEGSHSILEICPRHQTLLPLSFQFDKSSRAAIHSRKQRSVANKHAGRGGRDEDEEEDEEDDEEEEERGKSKAGPSKTVKIYCKGCGHILYRYRKGGNGALVKCFIERIAEDYTDGDMKCKGCGREFARLRTIKGKPAHKIIGGKVVMRK